MPVIAVPMADYHVREEPDHRRLGRRVDDVIRSAFSGRTIVARGVSADDHEGLTTADLIKIILTAGTDRYDPGRVGDRYENVDQKHIDLFGFRRTVTPRMRLFEQLSWGFYHGSIEVQGRPVRLDVISIYDASKLRAVRHRYAGRQDWKRDGFRFVEPDHKADAVLGVIRLER